jgi:hypothetical protein
VPGSEQQQREEEEEEEEELEMASSQYLHLITHVDDESMRDGLDWDPFTILQVTDFKASNIILQQDGDSIWVRMSFSSQHNIGLWAWRVKVGVCPLNCPTHLVQLILF